MTHDSINSPAHYAEGRAYEPIDVIADWELNYHLGNTLKYISRAGRKQNQLEDLKKARWYLDREISSLEPSVPFEATCNNIRVYELAHELGLSNREVLEACDSLDINVKGHSSSLNEHQASRIRDILLVPFEATYEDIVQGLIENAQRGYEDSPIHYGEEEASKEDWDDFWAGWDDSAGPTEVTLSAEEIDQILRNRNIADSDPDEIVKVIEKRGFLLGVKANGNTCVLREDGGCE